MALQELLSTFFSYPSHPIELEVVITIEVAFLTVFTLFFSFAGLKTNLNDLFQRGKIEFIEQIKKRISRAERDTLVSKINQITKRFGDEIDIRLDLMGQTFRTGIYSGLIIIIPMIILNEFLNKLWLQIFILLVFSVTQMYGLGLNVHRFKYFYELNFSKELAEKRALFEMVSMAADEGNYDLIEKALKNKRKWYNNLKSDMASLFKWKS